MTLLRWIILFLAMNTIALIAEEPAAPVATPEQTQWFRDAKFGLFIHWDPISIKGTEIGWSRGATVPKDVYDNLYKEFNPVKFDAKKWVETAKAAGMKYVVFTSKHMDGFAMFDTKESDYSIMRSPFKRDVCAELSKAVREGGLKLGWYYCIPDRWYRDWDYSTFRKDAAKPTEEEYTIRHVREICSKYGKVDILWFDENGEKHPAGTQAMVNEARKLQPAILVNDRAFGPQDYDTPEQLIGAYNPTRMWETCMTIGKQWSWKPDDEIKSLDTCIQTLVQVVGGGGNLLFNVGPMPDGGIEPRQVERLKEMGAWLKKYGESIYGTRGGPFRPDTWGVSTHAKDKIYLHILRWPADGRILLPKIDRRITKITMLNPGTIIVANGGPQQVRQEADHMWISVPEANRDPVDTIVVLQLDGPASDAKPGAYLSRSLTYKKKAAVSDSTSPIHAGDAAVDDDAGTNWRTSKDTRSAWLEVDLGADATFDEALIDEYKSGGLRVDEFEIQVKQGDAWKTVHQGKNIGPRLSVAFPAVTGRHVRLNLLKTNANTFINEFQLFAPGMGWIKVEDRNP